MVSVAPDPLTMRSPTEELLLVAQSDPDLHALRILHQSWTYTDIWQRVRSQASYIEHLLSTSLSTDSPRGAPVGLYTGMELDYVSGSHAIWLAGRTVLFLNPKWSASVLETILRRCGCAVVLYCEAEKPAVPIPGVTFVSTRDIPILSEPHIPSLENDRVISVPRICSITPTSGSTGVPKSIVYPMRKSLEILSQESDDILKTDDVQWLRGGTTFLRPLFEVRRFPFNKTVLHLDPGKSMEDQCRNLLWELQESSHTEPMRTHFTPSAFRVFFEYAKMMAGNTSPKFKRMYWLVLGGEAVTRDLTAIARRMFPNATIACNYACSESGFAGIAQCFIGPATTIPREICYRPCHGCEDLVLLDQHTYTPLPKHTGVSGIIGFVTKHSATHYLGNDAATQHMFRATAPEISTDLDMLTLISDDIGEYTARGAVVVKGRKSRNIKINGLFIDLDDVENLLRKPLSDPAAGVAAFKLMKGVHRDMLTLFHAGSATSAMVSQCIRGLLQDLVKNDGLTLPIAPQHLAEMPFNASFKVDMQLLQTWADASTPVENSVGPVAAAEVVQDNVKGRSAPLGPRNIASPQNAEDEDVDDSKTMSAKDESVQDGSSSANGEVTALANLIAADISKILKIDANTIDITAPLTDVGLHSIAMLRLYFKLQTNYDFQEEQCLLFDTEMTLTRLARMMLAVKDSSSDSDGTRVEEEADGARGTDTQTSPETMDEIQLQKSMLSMKDSLMQVKVIDSIVEDEIEVQPIVPDICDPLAFMDSTTELLKSGKVDHVTVTAHGTEQQKQSHTGDLTMYDGLRTVDVSWMTPLMKLGASRPLSADDLLKLNVKDTTETVSKSMDDFERRVREWDDGGREGKAPGLFGDMLKANTGYIRTAGLLWLLCISASLATPLFIQQIIICSQAPPRPSGPPEAVDKYNDAILEATGGMPLFFDSIYINAGILLALRILFTFAGRGSEQIMRRFALNVKTALINAVFEKTLSVDSLSFQRFSKGYVVNLVTVDCEGITGGLQSMHDLWAIPAQIVTVLAIMGHILGISVWAGAGGLIGAVFVVMFIAPALMARAAPQMSRFDDERIRLIKETVQGIKLVKAQVWEQIFASKIIAARANQAKSLFVFNIGIVCFVVVGQLGTTIAPVCAFSLYAAKGHMMKAAIVFPSIAFFSILVDPLIALPQTLSGIMSASQSWKRVYQFLTAKRQVPVTERSSHSAPAAETKLSSETAILIEKASFSWAPKEYHTSVDVGANATSAVLDSAFLKDINVNIPKGSLTAIVGVVGSGKTSLLSAITGHMQCVEGYAYVGGTFAYTSQQPWVQSTTVKDNITFGLPYDERKLQNVIRATAMQRDVDSFEDGIHSAIAEKGSNLSGGQKSRLACARAMYNDADIYVMDDPLAALDATVAREVFENCIRQGLASKTRILVTHHLDLLQAVDSIIVMSEGRVLEQGSFTELSKAGTHLSALLAGKARASEEQDDASEATTAEDPKVPSHIAATSASNTAIELSAETLPATIIAEEMSDSVSWSTYRSYIDAAGGGLILVSLLVQILLYQAGNVIMTQWLSWWTSDKFMQGTDWWIGRYNAVAWTAAFLLIIMNTNILRGVSRASNTFHQRAVEGVLRAPLSWFESQSVGRIVNRFSRDVAALDQAMMPIFFQLVAGLGTFLSIAVTVTYNVPIMSAVLGVMVIAYYLVFRYYHRTARELRRLEATERSPLYSYINETMEGIPTISAFRREDDFRHRAKQLIDQSNRASFLRYNAELWVTLRMDLISAVVIAVLAGLGETSFAGTASNFGMALAYSAALTYIMTIIVRSIANLESEIYSVLRLQEYADRLPSEAQGADIRVDPSKAWPSQGHIRVKGFSAHYASRPDRLCLQDVDLEILPGQRICMVGRTGSGKSTLLLALLRMIERDAGSITVDDREIHSMALEDLRHGLNLIVQDAYLFSGTIRTTLDIRQNLTDEQLWSALEAVDMKPYVSSLPQKLDTPVTGNGESISAGQRQLLCLARAVLDNPRILLLDEATGSVDAKTEQTIHKIIRERCPHATVLSVMHRLQEPVIAGFDKVLVMSDGSVAEFERPEVLLGRPDSLFSQLMKASSGKD